jgi:voltage-gated potassium channel
VIEYDVSDVLESEVMARHSGKSTTPVGNGSIRQKLHEVIFDADTFGGVLFDVLLLLVIVCSIIVISLETVQGIGWLPSSLTRNGLPVRLAGPYSNILTTMRWIFTALFTIEYLLRIYCVNRPSKYIFSFWGVVDLLAFLPDYILLLMPGSTSHGFAVIRSLRLIRVFRIFKLGWFQWEADDLGHAIWRARAKIIVFLATVMILVTVTGTLMFEIENELAGTDSQFHSIPDGIYWAIVTMTTVGFGDIVPVTVPGKFLSAFLILVGYSLIIVPTGFVTAEVIDARRRKITVISCPHCVTEGHDSDAKYCKYCGGLL